jgi:acyl-coenzyme A thioesterase PaaI-like protein
MLRPVDPAVLFRRRRQLARWPGGSWLADRLLGWAVPYSGSLGARVRHLEPGHARVELRDRRRVRNHLGSVHAVALVNLGELCSGLALLSTLGPEQRGIVLGLRTEFRRKARGTLLAECRTGPPPAGIESNPELCAEIRDRGGELVAVVQVQWRVGPRPAAR